MAKAVLMPSNTRKSTVTRRKVMTAFGVYLDWAFWMAAVKRGEESPPEGDNLADMAKSLAQLELAYQERLQEFISQANHSIQRT